MNSIDKAIYAYYKLCEERRKQYSELYKEFNVYNTVLGITLICKN